jgi:carbonic anhydrase
MEEGGPEQVNRLVELNVIEQCNDLIKTSIIQKAWQANNKPTVHGWVYNLEDGLIKELFNIEPDLEISIRYSDTKKCKCPAYVVFGRNATKPLF